MTTISANLQAVLARIGEAARRCGRQPEEISLLAVSKTWPGSYVQEAARAGQKAFGENYVQEGVDKVHETALSDLEWHFIGPLQSNKTRAVAEHFDWVHSIDRLRIAERLSAQRPADLGPLKVCIQVNIGEEEQKGGVAAAELLDLAREILDLERLRLQGLMCIPPLSLSAAETRPYFVRLRELKAELERELGLMLPHLSMGMSHDFEAAVAEGATLVRVGTDIFGQRDYGQG